MKWVAILVLLGLIALYVMIGGFGLVMSAFCFDAGTSQQAWQCFTGINLIFILPSLICVIAGIVLLLLRRYKWSIAVAATPAALALVAYLLLFVTGLM
jgi:hypothetical protein